MVSLTFTSWVCSYEYSPRVANVGTEQFATVCDDTRARRPTKPHILYHVVNLVVSLCECLCQSCFNQLIVGVLIHTMLREPVLEELLNLERQTVLQKPRYLLSIVSMAITDREEMAVSEVQHVGVRQVCILIHLVWVVSCYSTLGGE